ncbi:DEKNAAC100479 [Brettanomyces naardenensis]|uniref:Amine oxidase n=1 Tax=Brettanomyces naardenensis TaxID=13370 RepID=A0A448YFM7_BRENA|nr:DEKNAAC100479 [Brettanomyces naardenensis]
MTHPFDPMTDEEMLITSKLIKDSYAASKKPHFLQIDRLDPPKKDMIRYLEAEKSGAPLPFIPRVLYAIFYIGERLHKALVNTTYHHVIVDQELEEGTQGPLLPEDVADMEQLAYNHPICKAEIAKLKLPSYVRVVCDPWMNGVDCVENKLLCQCYMYLADARHSESNHYSLPLKFSPVFEMLTKKFVRMDYLPSGGVGEGPLNDTLPWTKFPFVEYHPDLNGETKIRELKPLIVEQPEGPSFSVEGHKIKWQGWEFYAIPTVREGLVLYDIHFLGRSIIYRLSMSEMTVPYGDPRAPFHRKQAFDLGDCGFGTNANRLALGCDCLGVIKYFDNRRTNREGEPQFIPNTICLHEQDYGLLYKHVNFRTLKTVVARRREFVVQTIATVANYEYAINYIFDQVGEIKIQVRATGILSTMPLDEGVTVPWGTNVGPMVLASYHQHLLSFRVDPALDGHNNTVCYDDTLRMEPNTKLNPHNVGFYTKRTYVEKAGYVEQSPFTNRAPKIINEHVINKISKKPVAYKIVMPARQLMMADPSSYNAKRAQYAQQQIWVTKYRDNELYAAGEFTNQSQDDYGVGKWANGTDNVRDTDNVVWLTIGFTHIPKCEDFPVMPVEIHEVGITPFGFFEKNPALDLPQASNAFNKSEYFPEGKKEVASCCSSKPAL